MRGEWVGTGPDRVWREWRPQPCLRGHDEWAPRWGVCHCGTMCRIWACAVEGCDDKVYDHPHG